MIEGINTISAEVERYADEVFSGAKTLLQIERHLLRKGWAHESVYILMDLIRDDVSRRKKGNAAD